jgi:hypothetical protein
MEAIATFMRNETAVIALGITAMILGCIAMILLAAVSVVSAFIRRAPGGVVSFAGVTIIVAMFAFATLMTSTMEMQYGPQGAVVQGSVYTLGGFLCVVGYARLTWSVLRNRRHDR